MTAQTAADLRAAADVLRRDGWTQGRYEDAGKRCLVGALRVTTGHGPMQISRYIDACDSVRLVLPGARNLPAWNDDEDRTADEVIAALEAAADAAEAQS